MKSSLLRERYPGVATGLQERLDSRRGRQCRFQLPLAALHLYNLTKSYESLEKRGKTALQWSSDQCTSAGQTAHVDSILIPKTVLAYDKRFSPPRLSYTYISKDMFRIIGCEFNAIHCVTRIRRRDSDGLVPNCRVCTQGRLQCGHTCL